MLKKIGKSYDSIELFLLSVGIVAIVFILFIQVIFRFALDGGLPWCEEVARILFIWISWLGISLGEKKGEHIKVSMLTDRFKGNTQKYVLIFSDILALIIVLIFLYEGISVTGQIMAMGTKTAALKIPRWLIYMAMPFSCSIMSIRLIKAIVYRFKGKEVYEQ